MKQLSGDFDDLEDTYRGRYDLDQLTQNYSQKWADTKAAMSRGADLPAEREADHQQRHADTEDAIRQIYGVMMDHLSESPDIEIIRDNNGRASAIRKGERLMRIERGPNGRATGLRS